MYKSIFVLFNLLIFSNLLSKENWSHVLEADSELFKSRFDMYIDVNSIVKEENLIYFTEKHVPKKIANVNGVNVGAFKTKFMGDCDKMIGKPLQIDVFSDHESTKLLESQKGNPNTKMEPFGNPELRLKKYCKYALNENKSITTKRQTSNPQVRVPAQKQQVVRNESTNAFDKYEKRNSMIRLKCGEVIETPGKTIFSESVYATDGEHLYEDSPMTKIVPGIVFEAMIVKSIQKKSGENTFLVKGGNIVDKNEPLEFYINFSQKQVIDNDKELDCYQMR